MKKALLIPVAFLTLGFASAANADGGTTTGLVGGAATGAVIGGPVGAVVGGAVGAIAGTAIDPPSTRTVTYVQQAPAPTQTVVVDGGVAVGQPLPETVVVQQIPEDPNYEYAVVGNQRVIVEHKSRKVVQIVQ
ncbi:hypothetical protein ASG25_21410 [Rhizobium sp. Leaf384]|uniref:DUF1236 domain-containing protein n=1 Tax=unclassified Rhizobium TaxID=2613769 RepID=UPI00071393F3|nr:MULTISPECIES: DUF1236 domain-containing protein [unclassified Rhizobium]KQS74348.1 hypothetical protein ASG25_21410 [Rhizobium sp. Leaf384]KQS83992.1 hypothetical protein ASG58_21790 [Rhizobium sp. Leaf383]